MFNFWYLFFGMKSFCILSTKSIFFEEKEFVNVRCIIACNLLFLFYNFAFRFVQFQSAILVKIFWQFTDFLLKFVLLQIKRDK